MPAGQPPNIVLIMVDDADTKVLEHEACAPIRDLIKDLGANATRYLNSHPLCAPSRASILRGRYPHRTGVVGNDQAYTAFTQNGGEGDNIAIWLQAVQYRTALIGKYINGYNVPAEEPDPQNLPLYVPPGWDYWFVVDEQAKHAFDYPANDNGAWVHYGTRAEDPNNYLTDVLALKALEFLGSDLADDPFLLVITPKAPHAPADPAPRHEFEYPNDLYPTGAANPSFNEDPVTDKPWYISMLEPFGPGQVALIHDRYRDRVRCMMAVAEMVDAIIDKLGEVEDRLENTYVFFTSDHGFHMGEHRLGRDELQDAEAEAPGGKNSMYEEDIRVPLWVRGPGVTAETVDQLLGNVDLAPTFLAIAGINPVAHSVDGRSFLPLLEGASVGWRNKFLISRGQAKPYAGIRMADDTVFAELTNPAPNEVRGEYYHLDTDPYQLENAYLGIQPSPLAVLRSKVAAYVGCAGDTCRTADSS